MSTKNVIHNAMVALHFRRSEEFGIVKDNFKLDMSAVRDRRRRMVAGLADLHHANFSASGAELIMGSAKFTGPRRFEVSLNEGGTLVVRGGKVVIGTGTRATIADIAGLRESNPLTHIQALELDYVAQDLMVFGGGYVGLELA